MWIPLKLHDKFCKPVRKTEGASGYDLVAREACIIVPGATKRIPLGISLQLPPGWEGQIRPRSGLSSKGILCALGTADSDYRGELSAILTNVSPETFHVAQYDRVAQLVVLPLAQVVFSLTDKLDETVRGEQGFGSSGMSALPSAAE